jgi:hypothetical protein
MVAMKITILLFFTLVILEATLSTASRAFKTTDKFKGDSDSQENIQGPLAKGSADEEEENISDNSDGEKNIYKPIAKEGTNDQELFFIMGSC